LRGLPATEDEGKFLDDAADAIDDCLDRAAKDGVREVELIEKMLHDDVAKYVYQRLRRRPMIVPVVIEV